MNTSSDEGTNADSGSDQILHITHVCCYIIIPIVPFGDGLFSSHSCFNQLQCHQTVSPSHKYQWAHAQRPGPFPPQLKEFPPQNKYNSEIQEAFDIFAKAMEGSEGDGWEYQGEKEGIKKHKKEISGSKLAMHRGEKVLDFPQHILFHAIRHKPMRLLMSDGQMEDCGVLEQVDAHCSVQFEAYKSPGPFIGARDLVYIDVIHRLRDGTIVSCAKSVTHESRPVSPQFTRGEIKCAGLAFQPIPNQPNQTLVIFVTRTDFGGSVPDWVINQIASDIPMTIQRLNVALQRTVDLSIYDKPLPKVLQFGVREGYIESSMNILKSISCATSVEITSDHVTGSKSTGELQTPSVPKETSPIDSEYPLSYGQTSQLQPPGTGMEYKDQSDVFQRDFESANTSMNTVTTHSSVNGLHHDHHEYRRKSAPANPNCNSLHHGDHGTTDRRHRLQNSRGGHGRYGHNGTSNGHVIPRALSHDMLGGEYQPDVPIPRALSALFDVPMFAGIGIGGALTRNRLKTALSQVEKQIDEEEEVELHHPQENITVLVYPDHDHDAIPMEPSRSILSTSGQSRGQTAVDIKREIETVLHQGYTRNLMIAVFEAVLGPFLVGWNLSVLNVPQQLIQHQVIAMDDTEWNLLNSLFCAGAMIGALGAGFMLDQWGRKMSMLLIDAVFIISAVITILYAHNDLTDDLKDDKGYLWFWSGRGIAGLASGASLAVAPTYLGEIAPPLIRGSIGMTVTLSLSFGILASVSVGYEEIFGGHSTWPLLFAPNLVPLLQILSAWSFPESPKWLFQKGRHNEARRALQKLRMTNDVEADIVVMKGVVSRGTSFASNGIHGRHSINGGGGKLKCTEEPLLGVPNASMYPKRSSSSFGIPADAFNSFKWALIISVTLIWMQQLSGINVIMFYSSELLAETGISSKKEQWLGTVGINAVNYLAVLIPTFFVDRVGRKSLLVISGSITSIAIVGASSAIILNDAFDSNLCGYSSIGFLILFVVGFEIGLGPIPPLIMAEVSPLPYRGFIVSVTTMMGWIPALLMAQISSILMDSVLKLYPFALITILGIVFTVKVIPETKGKTAVEIKNVLDKFNESSEDRAQVVWERHS